MITIRQAMPSDTSELMALERLSPDAAPLTVRLEPRVDHFALTARYPDAQGYVAVAPESDAVVGMVFASLGPTQLNGQLVPGVYIFSLRVHPGYRRRGIASALIAHAWEQARDGAGAEVGWAAVIGGNESSRRAFRRSGFDQVRAMRARVVIPDVGARPPSGDIAFRPPTAQDIPDLAAALNARHADNQLWRPLTGEQLASELAPPRHSLADTTIGMGGDGRIVSAASALIIPRLARSRLLGWRALPAWLNRLLAPLLGLLPVRFALARHVLLPPDRPAVARSLFWHLHHQHRSEVWGLAVTIDPLDPSWPIVGRLPGFSTGVHLMARSQHPIDTTRPWYLG